MFGWRKRIEPAPIENPVEPPPLPGNGLLGTQVRILGRESPLTIFDAGAHLGDSTEQYLRAFPASRVFAFEPASANFEAARLRLATYAGRVELLQAGVSDHAGTADLHLTSHDGSHSLLRVGDNRYFDWPIQNIGREPVRLVTLDGFCADRGIDAIDILKMDIQGGELRALQGARGLLARGAVRLIAMEVLFQPLYADNQPTFWDLADRLRGYGHALQGIYEPVYHGKNPAVLRWADAIFVSPQLLDLP